MRRFLFSLAMLGAFCLLAPIAGAQTPTLVSGTITDTNGVPYSFAKVSASLVGIPPNVNATILVNNIPVGIGGQQNANADVNGVFSMALFCNTAGGGCSVITPSGTQWQFTVNVNGVPQPGGKGPQICTATVTVTGATQSLTSNFNACPVLLNSGGAASPSSLGFFFGGLMGLSPKDAPYNAFGDWQIRNDCSAATNVVTCATSQPFVAGDVGKLFEFNCQNSASACATTGTISFFSSSSAVQVSITIGTVAGPTQMGWGHDDNVPLRQWVADISTKITGNGSSHSGYLPKGTYYTTKPLRLVANTQPGGGPTVIDSNCTVGSIGGAGQLCNDSLIIQGDGTTLSTIRMATAGQFNWAADGTSVNTGLMYVNNWSSYLLNGFALVGDGSQQNTTAQTGLVAGLMLDGNAHGNIPQQGVWTQAFHNTTHTLPGIATTATEFELTYSPYNEANDVGMWLCQASGSTVCEKQTFSNGYDEQSTTWSMIIGSNAGTNVIRQLRFENMHFISTGVGFTFGTSAQSDASFDSIVFSNSRLQITGGPSNGVVNFSGTQALTIDFANSYLSTAGTGTSPIFSISNTGALRLRVNGGGLNSTSTCASACIVNNTNANAFVFIGNTGIEPENSTDAFMFGGSAAANIATLHNTTSPLGAGMGTRGSLTASQFGTFTNCAVNSVSPAACGGASAGAFVVPTTTTTYTVNTTAVTAASRINVTPMSFAGNLPSAPTCVVPTTPFIATISAISAGTSFTLTLPSTTGQTCWQYQIIN